MCHIHSVRVRVRVGGMMSSLEGHRSHTHAMFTPHVSHTEQAEAKSKREAEQLCAHQALLSIAEAAPELASKLHSWAPSRVGRTSYTTGSTMTDWDSATVAGSSSGGARLVTRDAEEDDAAGAGARGGRPCPADMDAMSMEELRGVLRAALAREARLRRVLASMHHTIADALTEG